MYVYAFKCGRFIKIGMTRHVEDRRVALANACPYDIEVLWGVYLGDAHRAFNAERALHLCYDHVRHRGEWFLNRYPLKEDVTWLADALRIWAKEYPCLSVSDAAEHIMECLVLATRRHGTGAANEPRPSGLDKGVF